ncbi:MAG: branched-chain amino acid ABC transporter substrate-binding protein [Rubrobacter sp.]|nr:branched-chain amino acid ABC transporter substrate-binding protein [Rubrobacter sp.]
MLGVAAAFLIVGCSGGGGEQGTSSPTATIVSDLPLQGSSRPQNETIVNAIQLALDQRNNMAGDVQIKYQSQDDATAQAGKWDEAKCAQNAQSVAQNEEIVGWIGPFNSGCAQVQIPILNQAGLGMVSPANTYIGLTKPGGEPDEPEKFYPTGNRNYTRVIVADDKQGRAGAIWMRDLGVRSVYILDDQETYGKGLADQFQQNAEEQGIQVLGREGIDGKASNYRALMSKIAQLNPDAIYFGGITQNNAGQLVKDKVGAGMSNEGVVFMGPDGINEDAFIDAAGNSAEGVYVTFGGLPASELPGKGQDFVQNYKDKYNSDVEAYTAYGYEAANVLLDAIDRAYKADGQVTREGVVRELFATRNYDGVLGTWSFDQNGDTTLTQLSGQRVKSGKFGFDRTIDVA